MAIPGITDYQPRTKHQRDMAAKLVRRLRKSMQQPWHLHPCNPCATYYHACVAAPHCLTPARQYAMAVASHYCWQAGFMH